MKSKSRDKLHELDECERMLAIEAGLQRATLAATVRKWQERKLLAVGSTLATWGWRLFSVPKIRWLIAATVLSRLRGRHRHA